MQKSTENMHQHGSGGRGYETRDVNIPGAAIFGVTLFVVLLVVIFGMRGLFAHFENTQPLGPETTPFNATRELPPVPRLQVDPKQDLARTREEQRQVLESYGWADQGTGKVRIPIDRAMDLLLQRGLPVRAQEPVKSSAEAGMQK
jgi:hypothetical protein